MKKLLVASAFVLSVGLVEAAMPSMSQRAAVFAKMFQQQTRSKVSFAALAQVHRELPRASFKISPLLGAANALNGTLSRELKESKLAQSFFNQLPEEPIRYTVADGNPAKYLTPQLLGELLALHGSGELYKKEFFQSGVFKVWAALYKGPEDVKGFAAQVRKFLNRMQKEPDQGKIAELFSTATYFQGDTVQDLGQFFQVLGTELGSDEIAENKELMQKYANVFLELTAAQKDLSFLQAHEIKEMGRRCGEKALWSMLNVLLYNPETRRLDLGMLPVDVQPSRGFAAFVAHYPDPTVPKYYQLAYKDFLNLVDGISGVKYLKKEGYEIPGERSETLKIINCLLFPNRAVSSFEKVGNRLSVSGKRMVIFTEPSEKEYGDIKVCIMNEQDQKHSTSGIYRFEEGHVSFIFDKENKKGSEDMRRIAELDGAVGLPGVLVKLVPGYLHRLIDWANSSVAAVVVILEQNKITEAELNELSQGLFEKKSNLLHTAIEKQRENLVGYFLERGINPNGPDSNGDIPIILAMRLHNLGLVKMLLEAGVDVNSKNSDGESALYYAVKMGDKPIIKELLEAGASYQDIDGVDKSPLVVGMLEQGFSVDVDLGSLLWDAPGLFSENHKAQVFLEAIKRKKKMLATDYAIILNFMLTKGVDITIPDASGKTALGCAFRSGDLALLATLLSKRMFK